MGIILRLWPAEELAKVGKDFLPIYDEAVKATGAMNLDQGRQENLLRQQCQAHSLFDQFNAQVSKDALARTAMHMIDSVEEFLPSSLNRNCEIERMRAAIINTFGLI